MPRKRVFSIYFLPCVFSCTYYLLHSLLNSVFFNASNSVSEAAPLPNCCIFYGIPLKKIISLCVLFSLPHRALSQNFHPATLFYSIYSYAFQDISQAVFWFFLAQQEMVSADPVVTSSQVLYIPQTACFAYPEIAKACLIPREDSSFTQERCVLCNIPSKATGGALILEGSRSQRQSTAIAAVLDT